MSWFLSLVFLLEASVHIFFKVARTSSRTLVRRAALRWCYVWGKVDQISSQRAFLLLPFSLERLLLKRDRFQFVLKRLCWFNVRFKWLSWVTLSGIRRTKHWQVLHLARRLALPLWWFFLRWCEPAEHHTERSVWQVSYNAWGCFLQPVPLIITYKTQFLNLIHTELSF